MGARGNSGVILSQLLRGMADGVEGRRRRGRRRPSCRGRSTAGARRRTTPWRTRSRAPCSPSRGWPRSAPPARRRRGADDAELAAVVTAAAEGARAALAETPQQLDVLRRAGVVDAGGRGVCVLLDALVSVVTGADAAAIETRRARPPRPRRAPAAQRPRRRGPRRARPDLRGDVPPRRAGRRDPAAARGARRRSATRSSWSAREPTWNVHVHVDDVGAAVEAGIEAGRPHRIRVTHFRDAARAAVGELPGDSRGVVSVVAGDGLAALFEAGRGDRRPRRAGPAGVHRRAAHRPAAGPGPRPGGAAQRRRQPRGRRGRRGQGPRRGAAGRGDPDPGQRAGDRGAGRARPRRGASRTTSSR